MNNYLTHKNTSDPQTPLSAVLEYPIMRKGHPVMAGSTVLENFISPINATVADRLEAAQITIISKPETDQFGISGLFADSSEKPSGAILAIEEGSASFALCNDYTGKTARQAAQKGFFYFHPAYATVSRFGLVPAVPSMDQIGIICKTLDSCRHILSIISGHDSKDGVMSEEQMPNKSKILSAIEDAGSFDLKKLRVGIAENVIKYAASCEAINDFSGKFDTVGFELEYFDIFSQIMQILCCAELAGCISRYDGIKFGHRAQSTGDLHKLYTKSRTEAFAPDTKLAAILGAMVLSKENYIRYYDKAMRVRRLIKDSLDFNKYDIVLLPAFSTTPNLLSALGALPRLCGLPAVTLPYGGGITLISNTGCEDILFLAAEAAL